MKNKKLITSNLYVFKVLFFLFSAQINYAQSNQNINEKIKEGTLLMYENPDKAIEIANQIIANSKDNVDNKIKAYKLISDAFSSKRDYQKSLEFILKANQIIYKSKDELLKIIIINKLGIQYHQLKIYDKSIQYLDQAERMIFEYPIKDSIYNYLGANYIVRGFIYKEKLNCDIAIEFFDRGVNSLLKSKSKLANSAISIAKYNKGNCYIISSEYEKAKDNFQLAIQYANKVNAISLKAFALKGMAQVYTLEGKFKEALQILHRANAETSAVNDLILNQEIFKGLSENYLALNEWKNYKNFHDKYNVVQKLIKERERKSLSDSLLEKKSELKIKSEKETINFYITYLILFFVLFLIFFLIKFKTKKQKADLHKLKSRIEFLKSSHEI